VTLRRVQVTDFRCLHSAELEFDPRFTLISGANASGKTSLLEAIYVLARGRSFRTRRLDNIIRAGAERFVVFGEVELLERRVLVGVEGASAGVKARMAGAPVASLAELAAIFPAQIIDPEIHRLIEEGPSQRRRFLDGGVFHVEHSFLKNWQAYQQVLKQRNAALRLRQPRSLVFVWNRELLRLGAAIDESRKRYVERLGEVAADIARRLLGLELSLSYRSGWARELDFASALESSWGRDLEMGSTSVGPQRAELSLRLDGTPVKDRISRGQQKLLAAALLMAQVSLFPQDADARPTLLLDDPAAELDDTRLLGLIREIAEHAVQLIVTSLSHEFSAFGSPGRRYAIDLGVTREI
jgi:DNA replication and repair protein RecF